LGRRLAGPHFRYEVARAESTFQFHPARTIFLTEDRGDARRAFAGAGPSAHAG
jgi:hypothetical protein